MSRLSEQVRSDRRDREGVDLMEDQTQRVQMLRAGIEERRTRRAHAQASYDQATRQLQSIFTEYGVTSIEELQAKAVEARQNAEELLVAAEKAISA